MPRSLPRGLQQQFPRACVLPAASQDLPRHPPITVSLSVVPLCNPMDCSPPGSYAREVFQARLLAWVAISSSRGEGTQGS